MAAQVKFAHASRRRAIVDSPQAPRVSLRVTRAHDDLDPARGVLYAALLGLSLWAAIFLAWFIWS